MSNESGREQVYVTRFPSGQGKWQVSTDGGFWPRWSRAGDRLFYTEQDQAIVEVDIATRPALVLGVPRKLFTRRPSGVRLPFGWPDGFDVSADGKRFLVLQPAGEQRGPTAITLVENWFAEFRDKGRK